MMIMDDILLAFGLNISNYRMEAFGSGLINDTWKITGERDQYILQRINSNVFKFPQVIANNLVKIENYLQQTAPGYLFPAPLPAANGDHLVQKDGAYYRLTLFLEKSHTVDFIDDSKQAYEAARQFGKFTRLLKDFNLKQLEYTLTNFHNLSIRVDQFKDALANCSAEKMAQADNEILQVQANLAIAKVYEQLVRDQQIPLRVIHHDTKINNILFDEHNRGLCVIDLDTVMPGYFISDVGDMMRTYLSPANEEERDLNKIQVNTAYFIAVYKGYMEEMGNVLTAAEKGLFIYAGKFMIYMQAMRFLTDFLNGDIYYHITYPGHNLSRAQNQLTLLNRYQQSEKQFVEYMSLLNQQVSV